MRHLTIHLTTVLSVLMSHHFCLTQPLTTMSTKQSLWWKGRPIRKADNLATFMCCVSKSPGSLKVLEPSGPVQD